MVRVQQEGRARGQADYNISMNPLIVARALEISGIGVWMAEALEKAQNEIMPRSKTPERALVPKKTTPKNTTPKNTTPKKSTPSGSQRVVRKDAAGKGAMTPLEKFLSGRKITPTILTVESTSSPEEVEAVQRSSR